MRLNDELRSQLNGPDYAAFRNAKGELNFSQEMLRAFGASVSNIAAVPVSGGGPGQFERYVLEVDVIPANCENIVFSHLENEVAKTHVRVGSSNVLVTDTKGFEVEVRKRASWRREAELTDGARDPVMSTEYA